MTTMSRRAVSLTVRPGYMTWSESSRQTFMHRKLGDVVRSDIGANTEGCIGRRRDIVRGLTRVG
jgi:hypothetical protein